MDNPPILTVRGALHGVNLWQDDEVLALFPTLNEAWEAKRTAEAMSARLVSFHTKQGA